MLILIILTCKECVVHVGFILKKACILMILKSKCPNLPSVIKFMLYMKHKCIAQTRQDLLTGMQTGK